MPLAGENKFLMTAVAARLGDDDVGNANTLSGNSEF
jgi:hypothetical protein